MNYIPVNETERKEMLDAIGVGAVSDLFSVIPQDCRLKKLSLPDGVSEQKLVKIMEDMASKNISLKEQVSFLGAGVYDHFIPSLVEEVIGRSEFSTAYTPYQAEASQGTLQAVFEYQSLICELTGLDVANASLYDGASAVAEAAMLAMRATGRKKILISSALHPEYIQVVKTYLQGIDSQIIELPAQNGVTSAEKTKELLNSETAAVIIQSPNFYGSMESMNAFREMTKAHGILLVSVVNPISLGIFKAPGEYGADIAVGEGQVLGNSTGFGGVSFGFMACQKALAWKMPGRIVGQTVDKEGKRGFVLTLQSREQHIRREKATSNICTNAALNALAGCVYLSGWGPDGLKQLASANIAKSRYTYDKITSIIGFKPAFENQVFFNEFAVRTTKDISAIKKKLEVNFILGPLELGRFNPDMKDCLLFCVTEARTKEEIDGLYDILKGI